MPTVPSVEYSDVQAEGLPGRPNPRVDTDVSALDFGAGLASGIEDVGTAGADVQAKAYADASALRLIQADTQVQAAKNARLYGTPGPDGKLQGGAYQQLGENAINLGQVVLPKFDEDTQQIAGSLPPYLQRQFAQHVANARNELSLQLDKHEFEQGNALADQTYTSAAQQSIANASLDWGDPQSIGKARLDLKSLVALRAVRDGWSPEMQSQQLSAQLSQLHSSVVAQMLDDKSPQAAMSYLSQVPRGELPPALEEKLQAQVKNGVADQVSQPVIDAYRSQGPTAGIAAFKALDAMNLPDDVKAQARANVDKGLNGWHADARNTYGNDIEKIEQHIAAGTADASDRAAIWQGYQNGAFTADQAGSAIGRLEKAQQKAVEDDVNAEGFQDAYQKSSALDPKDPEWQKAGAAYFNRMHLTPGSQEWINVAADIAQKTGVTPKPVIDWARSQLVSGAPSDAATAAQAIQRQVDANPRGLTYALDEETKATAKVINDSVRAGTDPTVAVENARKLTDMSDADRKRLDQIYEQKGIAKSSVSDLTSQLSGLPGFDQGWFSSNPTAPPEMVGQFQQLQHEYFRLTNGNATQASQLAFNDLKNTWGVSKVNGKPELMQFAPEAQGLKTADVRADMEASAAGHTSDPTKVRLLTTPDTQQSGGQRFALGVPDKFGAYSVLTDAQGRVLPYQIPNASAALKAAQAKAASAGMAALRAKQAAAQASERGLMDSVNQEQQMRRGYGSVELR